MRKPKLAACIERDSQETHNDNRREIMKRILSLGGGVQSSTLLLMSYVGEIDRLDAAFFADTGWERKATYGYIEYLKRVVDIPILTVKAGNIKTDMLEKGENAYDHIPFFTKSDGARGIGQLRRQCTRHYKIMIMRREIRKWMGGKREYEKWIGFSLDEAARVNRGKFPKYITPRYPLLEKPRKTRLDCLNWLRSNGFEIPVKSSCIGCPYHSDSQWKSLDPDELAEAIEFDKAIRDNPFKAEKRKSQPLYLHRSAQPLDEALQTDQLELFDYEQDECEGGCFL
jgi:hypothetical protein